MSAVVVDSVGVLALWDEDDQWHEPAQRAFLPIGDGRTRLITTLILAECGNAAARHPFRVEANQLREQFESAGTLIWPTEEDWRQAWSTYRRGEADAAGIESHLVLS